MKVQDKLPVGKLISIEPDVKRNSGSTRFLQHRGANLVSARRSPPPDPLSSLPPTFPGLKPPPPPPHTGFSCPFTTAASPRPKPASEMPRSRHYRQLEDTPYIPKTRFPPQFVPRLSYPQVRGREGGTPALPLQGGRSAPLPAVSSRSTGPRSVYMGRGEGIKKPLARFSPRFYSLFFFFPRGEQEIKKKKK